MKFLVFFVPVIEYRELDERDKMKEIVDKIKIWAHLEQLTEGKEKKKWWEVAVTSEENKWKQINWRRKKKEKTSKDVVEFELYSFWTPQNTSCLT